MIVFLVAQNLCFTHIYWQQLLDMISRLHALQLSGHRIIQHRFSEPFLSPLLNINISWAKFATQITGTAIANMVDIQLFKLLTWQICTGLRSQKSSTIIINDQRPPGDTNLVREGFMIWVPATLSTSSKCCGPGTKDMLGVVRTTWNSCSCAHCNDKGSEK